MQAELLSVTELRARMKDAPLVPLDRNTFYRDCPVAAYALYGTGPLYGLDLGARYSPKGSFPVIYLAADRLLAQLEAAHHLNRLQPEDHSQQIRLLHQSLSSLDVSELLAILKDMAGSENGYEVTEEISRFLKVPLVNKLFTEDPARLQVFLDMGPHLRTPLRCITDTSRISVSVNVTARGVLDLTDDKTLKILGVEKSELLLPSDVWQNSSGEDMPLTQRIGLAAWDAPGVDGILAPTALPQQSLSQLVNLSTNLVLFMHEKEKHRPRSNKVSLDTEEEFVKLAKLFWIHRPQWLLDALERNEPLAARAFRNIGS